MKSEIVVVISFNSHDTNFASWHIFTCHKALRLFKNNQNTKFRVVAVSQMPQSVVVFFSPQLNERFRSLSINQSIVPSFRCGTWGIHKVPPPHSVLGDALNLCPGLFHSFSLFKRRSSPRVFRPPSTPFFTPLAPSSAALRHVFFSLPLLRFSLL